MVLDRQKATGLSYAASDDSSVGFDILKPNGVRFAVMFFIDGFFVPFFHQLVSWVQGEKSRRYCLLVRYVNLHSVRLFPFDIGVGGYTKGAFIMTQTQQAKSANKTKQQLIMDGLDATGESVDVLYQAQALFNAIINHAEKHSDIHQLATIGTMLTDFSVASIESYHNQFSTLQGGAA